MTISTDSVTPEATGSEQDLRARVREDARAAKQAASEIGQLTRDAKDGLLASMADALVRRTDEILAANRRDVDNAREAGTPEAMIDRLALSTNRVAGMADGLRTVAALPDPIGEVERGDVLANGLRLQRVRVPLGVVGMVYEGRPNVTVDAAGLALKAGNAVLLRGSASAEESNTALVGVLADVLVTHGLSPDAIRLLPCRDRASVQHLITARGLVDLVIPRGGAGLISAVVEQATVPVIETGVGNCHVYVDAAAQQDTALRILLNAKTRRTSVCNAAETLLVHRDVADRFVPAAVAELAEAGVTVHADERFLAAAGDANNVVAATEADWDTEYLSLDIAAAVVDSLPEALEHIATHGTGHTEAIVSEDLRAVRTFTARVDAAAVMVNASTAFTDGGQFGMGAEIGVSTQKLHARGPMGLAELTSSKWLAYGDGHIRDAS